MNPAPAYSPPQAVVLAGGLGLRLRSAVPDLPKVMAPVGGRPFLAGVLAGLREQGLRRVLVCLGYRAEAVAEYFGDGARLGLAIDYAVEAPPAGTGGALWLAAPKLEPTFLLLNGDTSLDLDVEAFWRYHRARDAVVTLAGRRSHGRPRPDVGYVLAARGGRVVAFSRGALRPPVARSDQAWACCGWYMCEREMISRVQLPPPGAAAGRFTLERGFLAPLLGSVYVYPSPSPFTDIGTPERYRRLRQEVEANDRP